MWKKKNAIKSLNRSLSISSFIGALLSFILLPSNFWWIGLIIFVATFIKAKGALLAPIMFKTANQASTII